MQKFIFITVLIIAVLMKCPRGLCTKTVMLGEMIKEALHSSDNRQLPTQYPYRSMHMDNVWGIFWYLQPYLCTQDVKA